MAKSTSATLRSYSVQGNFILPFITTDSSFFNSPPLKLYESTKWKKITCENAGGHKNFKNSLTPLCSTQQVSGLDGLVGSGNSP